MAPKKDKAAPAAPPMTQAAIRKLVKDSIADALVAERAAVAARAAEAASQSNTAEPATVRRE